MSLCEKHKFQANYVKYINLRPIFEELQNFSNSTKCQLYPGLKGKEHASRSTIKR